MDFDAALSFIRVEIEKALQGRPRVSEGYLAEYVNYHSGLKDILDERTKAKLVRHLETLFWTSQDNGHTLTSDIAPWYMDRLQSDEHDPYYWSRLRKWWEDHSIIPNGAIRSTHQVTDDIMDYIGDPKKKESWHRRGLVMGHVQSGKTTNYSALIAKAADAGYRIIVVLAGLTNSLRKQTQERLDQSFVGRSSVGDEFNPEIYPVSRVFIGHPRYPGSPKHPYCGTTQLSDFSVNSIRNNTASEGNFADPILFVTKKHESVLKALTSWLSGLRQDGLLEGPMLLIDDEADNASVNTAKDGTDVSRINQRIRELLKCSRRTSYVGYTATPFANIFIHPDSIDEMLREDLFPKHFIKSLDPPSNYIGAKDLFGDEGRLVSICVHDIPEADYVDLLPLNHKSTKDVMELPPSLIDAVMEFFLFRALKILDGDSNSHTSMMINVSRFNNVQRQIYDYVDHLKQSVLDATNVWAKSPSWAKSDTLMRMRNVWLKQYAELSEFTWDNIRQVLHQAVVPVETRLVNMQGKGLDYSSNKNKPLHVIAIGGLALSRGLTLEGLAVSYVLRNVGAADTLLQMGRWFGYRPGYEKLCRIHVTEDMREHFAKISNSIEELKDDLERMESMNRTPDEFGLKVRESETGISITAANKMRTAKPIYLSADYSESHIQGYDVFDNKEINNSNLSAVKSFVNKLKNEEINSQPVKDHDVNAYIWKDVDASEIIELIRNFNLPTLPFSLMAEGNSLISDYISDKFYKHGELGKWAVAIPYTTSSKGKDASSRLKLPFPITSEKSLYCRQRNSAVRDERNHGIIKITAKNVVADPGADDLGYGEEAAVFEGVDKKAKSYLRARTTPVLIIHSFQLRLKENELHNIPDDQPTVSLSCGFPSSESPCEEHLYAASVRLMEQMKKQLEEQETDEVFEA